MTFYPLVAANAMRIAKFYRRRNIAEAYARQLLNRYMLRHRPPGQIQKVIDGLITSAPDHEFDMDYHICRDIGLSVAEADQELSDLTKELVHKLDTATNANIICGQKFSSSDERRPFFHYEPAPYVPNPQQGEHPDVRLQGK